MARTLAIGINGGSQLGLLLLFSVYHKDQRNYTKISNLMGKQREKHTEVSLSFIFFKLQSNLFP